MKSILMSIQPKWCKKIFNGEKTIFLTSIVFPPPKPPFKVVVYCTKGNTKIYLGEDRIFHTNCAYDFETGEILENILMNGKVIGEFVCEKVEAIPFDSGVFTFLFTSKLTYLTTDELIEYCSGKDMYGLHISDLIIYEEPKELGEFRKVCREWDKNEFTNKCRKCQHYFRNDYDMCYECDCEGELLITRPPQNFVYVEEIEE